MRRDEERNGIFAYEKGSKSDKKKEKYNIYTYIYINYGYGSAENRSSRYVRDNDYQRAMVA